VEDWKSVSLHAGASISKRAAGDTRSPKTQEDSPTLRHSVLRLRSQPTRAAPMPPSSTVPGAGTA